MGDDGILTSLEHWLILDIFVSYILFHLAFSFCTSCTVRVTYCATFVWFLSSFLSRIPLSFSISFFALRVFSDPSLAFIFFSPLMSNDTCCANGKAKGLFPRCCLILSTYLDSCKQMNWKYIQRVDSNQVSAKFAKYINSNLHQAHNRRPGHASRRTVPGTSHPASPPIQPGPFFILSFLLSFLPTNT